MDCFSCKMTKISPYMEPYGGFLCPSGHMQCRDCNTFHNGLCRFCDNATNFILMTFNPLPPNLAAAQAKIALSAVGQSPTAPVLSNSNTVSEETPSMYIRSQSMFAEIENHSSISQEQLSMKDFKEDEDTMASPEANVQRDNIDDSSSNDGENASTVLMSTRSLYKTDLGAPNLGKAAYVEPAQILDQVLRPELSTVNIDDSFVFQEDPDDHDVIHTSEIRFMDSTESMNNLLRRDSVQKTEAVSLITTPPTATYDVVQNRSNLERGVLSTKQLHDHNSRNTGLSNEIVEHYLQVYGPIATYQFPGYNCQQPHCDFHWGVAPPAASVSVSTESEPSLRSVQQDEAAATTDVGIRNKFGNKNYVVMHTNAVGPQPIQNIGVLDKFEKPNLDMRMQRILKTFQEDPKIPQVTEKLDPAKDNIYMQLSNSECNELNGRQVNNYIELRLSQSEYTTQSANDIEVVLARHLNAHRALYQPPDCLEPLSCSFKNPSISNPGCIESPPAQFQSIDCTPSTLQKLISVKVNLLNSKPATIGHMTPLPIQCPESECSRILFISDFIKHFEVDHNELPMERIAPFQCKNVLLNPRLDQCGISKCHYLFLLKDKIAGLGGGRYKNYLPVLVMSSTISLAQMCGISEEPYPHIPESLEEFLTIWLTGIVPEELPISVSLTVWSRSDESPGCHLVHSGDMYSICESQKVMDVVRSGHMLMLSAREVDLLTNGGTEMLNVQLMVH